MSPGKLSVGVQPQDCLRNRDWGFSIEQRDLKCDAGTGDICMAVSFDLLEGIGRIWMDLV